jgi:hypothetical protein
MLNIKDTKWRKYGSSETFLAQGCISEISGEDVLTGATNLITHYGLEHTYNKFSGKKVKEQLSSFLSTLVDGPGNLSGYNCSWLIIVLTLNIFSLL